MRTREADGCHPLFHHFTPAEEAVIGGHLKAVRAAVHDAIADLERLIAGADGVGAVRGWVECWFRGASGPAAPEGEDAPDAQDGPIGVDDYQAVLRTLGEVRDGLGVRPVRFGPCPFPDGGTWALRRRNDPLLKGTGVIRLYPRFWEEVPSFQAGVVFHELTHWHAGTKDYGYLHTPYLPGRYVKGGARAFLSTEERTGNADTYEGFLTRYLNRYYP